MASLPTGAGVHERVNLPDQVTMGLLPYLTAHALDEDYALAAARRGPRSGAGPDPAARRRIGLAGGLALVVFAVLAATAAMQTSKDSGNQERERQALISQVKSRKAAVEADRRTVAKLQLENNRLEAALLRNTSSAGGVLSRLDLLGLRSGTSAVRGQGVAIVVDDAVNAESDRNRVLDSDLQALVNGLWRAGAEAISINSQRITNLTAIRHAGTAITVNFSSLDRPYRILAIGDRNRLPQRFADTTSGRTWLDLQRQVGLRFSMRAEKSLQLPAATVPDLRYAKTATSKTKELS
jgi:uncharacterized protein YlxW (UPF0749 family)